MVGMRDLVLPPDHGTRYRKRASRWCGKYDAEGTDTDSPNYVAWVAQIVTGLYQAQPPTITVNGEPLDQATDPTTGGDVDRDGVDEEWTTEVTEHVVDMLEEAGERQAGTGLAILRPVHDGERWTHQVLDPSHVAPTWNHRRLVSAVVWTFHRHPDHPDPQTTKRIAIVEYWGMNRDGEPVDAPQVVVAVGDLDPDGSKFTADEFQVWDSYDALPATLAALPFVTAAFPDETEGDDPARELITVAWKWSSGDPTPIYFRNEGLIAATMKLHEVEQTDAVMVRKRVAMSRDLLGSSDVTYQRQDGGKVIARAGWQLESNLLLLDTPAGSFSEDGPNIPFQVIEFNDDLTQADRINRRREWVLTHCGINPQSVGMSVGGRSDSAAAKRADQQQTMNTVSSPARRLSAALSRALTQEDRLNSANGVGDSFGVTVHEGLKPVASEAVATAATMESADLASTRTIVETANPGRTDAWYTSELERMEAEGRTAGVAE